VIGGEVHRAGRWPPWMSMRWAQTVRGVNPTSSRYLSDRPTDGCSERDRQVPARWWRGAPPSLDRLRAHGPELHDKVVVR